MNTDVPVEIQSQLISSSERERETVLQMKLLAHNVCQNLIAPAYIDYAFAQFNSGFLYKDAHDAIVGFSIWNVNREMSKSTGDRYATMTILLICGINQSITFCNRLFPDIDSYCMNHGISNVYLEPANETLKNYYETYGFVYTKEFHFMTKLIPVKLVSRNKRRKVRREPSNIQ